MHPLQTDGQTDGRTDGRTTTMPMARPLLKYGRLKMAHVFVRHTV